MSCDEKILIVDDQKEIRELFEEVFTEAGYCVSIAENGEAALKKFESENIKLVLSDIRMPGMNGIELCKRIREISESVPVFAMTGYYNEFTSEEFSEVGFADVLYKPVKLDKLLQLITSELKSLN